MAAVGADAVTLTVVTVAAVGAASIVPMGNNEYDP